MGKPATELDSSHKVIRQSRSIMRESSIVLFPQHILVVILNEVKDLLVMEVTSNSKDLLF